MNPPSLRTRVQWDEPRSNQTPPQPLGYHFSSMHWPTSTSKCSVCIVVSQALCFRGAEAHCTCTQKVGSVREWMLPGAVLSLWLLTVGITPPESFPLRQGFLGFPMALGTMVVAILLKHPLLAELALHLPVFLMVKFFYQGQLLERPKLRQLHHCWGVSARHLAGTLLDPHSFTHHSRTHSYPLLVLTGKSGQNTHFSHRERNFKRRGGWFLEVGLLKELILLVKEPR